MIEDMDDPSRELAEEILAEMPTVFDPGEFAEAEAEAETEDIIACENQTVPFDQDGCDQDDPLENESAGRSSQTKVAGSIGVGLVALAFLVGWFALRPADTTASAVANISQGQYQIDQLTQPQKKSFPRLEEQVQPALAMPSSDTDTPVPVNTQLSSAVSTEAAYLPSAATASAEIRPMSSPNPQEPIAQQATTDAPVQEEPSRGFALTCILLGSAEGRAVINGTTMALVEMVNQAKLVQILPNSVEMLKQGQRFVLSLQNSILSSDSIVGLQVRAQ